MNPNSPVAEVDTAPVADPAAAALLKPPPSHCAFRGCGLAAKYTPTLELYALVKKGRSVTRWRTPAKGELDLGLCDAHGKTATADDFITPESWAMITDEFKRAGRLPPARHLTKLKLAEIIRPAVTGDTAP